MPVDEREFAVEVVKELRGAGYEALWAGGCVRDLQMGNEPSDYDVATSATPHQVREVFGKRRTLPVGVAFGVVIVLSPNRPAVQVEVATFRTDGDYSDGRHPDSVVFSTAEEDAQRRDFTINGMFYDPLTQTVIDHVGGRADITSRLIRAIGNADDRIAEDKLRMLRAIRFAAKFGFGIEAETRAAIAHHAPEVARVSGERICTEVRKTLETRSAAWAVSEWSEAGLLDFVLPEVRVCWAEHKTPCARTLEAIHSSDWLHKLCVMLWYAVGSEAKLVEKAIQSLRDRLKLANDDSEIIRFCLTAQLRLHAAESQKWSQLQPVLSHKFAGRAVDLYASRAAALPPEAAFDAEAMAHTIAWLRNQLDRPADELDPEPLLNGGDLLELGRKPGPRFRELLSRARIMQLDGELLDRPMALAWLKSH